MSEHRSAKAQPVVTAGSILAGLTALGAALAGMGLDSKYVTIFISVIAALNVGVAWYIKNQVVPYADTATYINSTGVLVAGPASPLPSETPILIPDQL